MAAQMLVAHLAKERAIDAPVLRTAMEDAFGASDVERAWSWKDAYEAVQAAQILLLRRLGPAIFARAENDPSRIIAALSIGAALPSETRRSEESQSLQQISTPLELAYVASLAAGIVPSDVVLEPSAGTGLLAIFAELSRAKLILNEWAETRRRLLELLFPAAAVSRYDGAQINDRLDLNLTPSVVLMNPPFSASPLIKGRHAAATFEHLRSALLRLRAGGRLIAITGESFAPASNASRASFERLQEHGRLVFTTVLMRGFFARHGTSVKTRLTIFDRTPAENPKFLAAGLGAVGSLGELVALIQREVPPRCVLPSPSPQSAPSEKSFPFPRSKPLAPAAPSQAATLESQLACVVPPTSIPTSDIAAQR
jgi:predicted RNA methylase